MNTANRDWQTFARRWRTWPWLAFAIVLSIALHAGLGFLGEEALEAQSESTPGDHSSAAAEPRPRSTVKNATKPRVNQPLTVANEQFKLELAAGQLRGFFDSLVGDLLPPEQADALWVRTVNSLLPELDALANAVAASWGDRERPYEALASVGGAVVMGQETLCRPEVKIQQARARLVEALTHHVVKDRNQRLSEEILTLARDMTAQMAEHYRKDLADKLGLPLADKLNALREKDAAARMVDLTFAEAAFVQATPVARQAAEMQSGLDELLEKGVKELQAARAKKDNAGANRIAAGLRDRRPTLGSAHQMIAKVTSPLQYAVVRVIGQTAIENYLDETRKTFTTAQKDAYAALAEMGNLMGDNVLVATRKAAESSRQAALQGDVARAVIVLQIVREQSDRLNESILIDARQAGKLGEQQAAAQMAKDASKAAAAAREMDLIARELNVAQKSLEQMQIKLAKAEAFFKDAAVEFKAVQAKWDGVQTEMRKAENALAGRMAAAAVASLKKTSELLEEFDAQLMAVQKKAGVKDEPNPGIRARRQIEKMQSEGKLAAAAKEHFENYYRTVMKDRLLKKMDAGLSKRLQAERSGDPALIESLRGQLDKIFDRELLAQVHPEVQVARALEERLPLTWGQRGPLDPKDEGTAGAARQVLDTHSSYSLPGIAVSAISLNAFYRFTELPYSQRRRLSRCGSVCST